MPNLAPVTALAIFGAAFLPKKQAVALPLAVRFISDIFLGFFAWPQMVAVYGAHLVGVLFGLWIRKSTGATPEFFTSKLLSVSEKYPGPRNMLISGSRLSPDDLPMSSAGMVKSRWPKILASSLGASIIFFLATNFALLYPEPQYSHNWSGIMLSYYNGLPFFRGTLLGDLGYTVGLFGAYQLTLYVQSVKQRGNRVLA